METKSGLSLLLFVALLVCLEPGKKCLLVYNQALAGRDGVAGADCADQRGQGYGEAIGDGQEWVVPPPAALAVSYRLTRDQPPSQRCLAQSGCGGRRSLGRGRKVLVVVIVLLVMRVVVRA
jgi:hypothetical protein